MIFSRQHRSRLLAALLIIGLGFAVRMINLGGDSFWLDEIFTVRVVTLTPPHLVPRELDHPPLLHLLARWSSNIFGENEFAFRLPSALVGVLALPLLIAVGQRMARPRAGLWAAFLLALSPFHLRYSQEARQYALLMTFSLAAFFWLYRVIEPDPKGFGKPLRSYVWHWLGFATATVLNLYSHYGALIFLAVQTVIITGWGVGQLRRRHWQRVGMGVAAAFLTILLYLPWLNRLQEDLTRNVGAGSQANSFDMASVGQWLEAGFYAFGTTAGLVPYVMAMLFAAGFFVLAWQKQWRPLLYLGLSSALPLLFIILFQVNRAAWPRYIIYLLPLYLLAVGVTLAWGQELIATQANSGELRRTQRSIWLLTTGYWLLAASLILLTHLPQVRSEHKLMLENWRGVTEQLTAAAQDGDVVVTMSLNFPFGDNIVFGALPYYLDRSGRSYTVLHGNQLDLETVLALRQSQGDVWVVFTNWNPQTQFADPTIAITPYDLNIFVIHSNAAPGSTLAHIIALYEQILPLSSSPVPRCLLWKDLTGLYLAHGQLVEAAAALQQSQTLCADYPIHAGIDWRPQFAERIYQDVHQTLRNAGPTEAAAQLAERWAQGWLTEPDVVQALTWDNLLERYQNGEMVVDDAAAPKPVAVVPFTLPGQPTSDALFIHPPARIQYHVTLPAQPVALRFRTAMFPDSWAWGGDGATFVVTVQPESGAAIEIYRHHVSNTLADQKWHLATLSLAEYAGQTITLTFHTESGPNGDTTGDWAGWETPRLIWEVSDGQ